MPRARINAERSWTASQVVAHNLTRARELRALTQSAVAERLSKFTGTNWSQATVAQAEGSVSGQRVRQFTANEIVALARTFDLPVLFFFLPPDDGDGRLVTDDHPGGLAWDYLVVLLLGHRDNFGVLAERAAAWEQAIYSGVEPPRGDAVDDGGPSWLPVQRTPLLPEDVLAAAFHGLAARRMRGAPRPGEDIAKFAENLRGLADALMAFNNYRPGTFVDPEAVDEIAAGRRRKTKQRRARPAGDAEEAGDE